MPLDTFFWSYCVEKCNLFNTFTFFGVPRTPLWELTALPQPSKLVGRGSLPLPQPKPVRLCVCMSVSILISVPAFLSLSVSVEYV